MQKYRASNHVPFASFILLILVGLLSAVGAGLLLWAAETYLNIYLIIVFPIIAALIVGGALALVVRAGKVRSPFIATLFGLLAGLLLYATYHFAGYYITFRGDMRAIYVENAGRTPTDAEFDSELNALMEEEVGASGFVGYLQILALEGFSITRSVGASSSSSGIDLQGNIVYGYWAVELLIIMVIAALLPRRSASEPFDEDSNEWYGKPTLIGVTTAKARKPLQQALENGDFQAAGGMLTSDDIKFPRTEVSIRRSPVETGLPQDVYLTISYAQRRGRSASAKNGIIAPTELEWLTRAMRGDSREPASSLAGSIADTPSERFEF